MKSLRNLKRSAIALSLVAGMSVVGSAEAGSLAQSVLTLNNFLFLNAGTNTPIAVSQFSALSITDGTNINPSVNGVNNPFSTSTTGGVPLGQNVRCVPSGCPAFLNPGTPFAPIASPASGDGSLGASNLQGAPISGLGFSTGATAQVAALSELTSTGFASTNADLTLTTDFTFTLAQSQGVTIDFDAIAHLYANRQALGSTNASMSWSINIVDNSTGLSVFNWAPDGNVGTGISGGTEQADGCNLQRTVTSTSSFDCSGHETATTGILAAGTSYTLSLSHNDRTIVTLVPEPETLLLMGLGVVGLGLAQRRRARKA